MGRHNGRQMRLPLSIRYAELNRVSREGKRDLKRMMLMASRFLGGMADPDTAATPEDDSTGPEGLAACSPPAPRPVSAIAPGLHVIKEKGC